MKRILWAILWIAISANLPAPLFSLYQANYQLNDLAITTLFAIYAACLLPVLLISGSLADLKGLRWVSGIGLILAFLSALFFYFAINYWMLYIARILEGLAVGLFMGTSNALLLQYSEREVSKSLNYSSILTMFGFGFGPLLCGLIVQYSPFIPHQLPYLLLLIGLGSALVLFSRLEKKDQQLKKDTKIRITLGIPEASKKFFWLFVGPAAFTMLALNGIVISLIPTYTKVLFHSNNLAFSGILLFLMLSGSGLAQLISYPHKRILRVQMGIFFLIIGTWFMIVAAPMQNLYILTWGMIFQAIGTGWTFQGTLQLTGQISSSKNRSLVMSTFFVCAYSGMAFPTIGIGFLSTIWGLMTALLAFGLLITVVGISIICMPLLLNFYNEKLLNNP